MKQSAIDAATINQQQKVLAQQAERIHELELELEIARAQADAEPSIREQFLLERARWYRTLANFYKNQAAVAAELLRIRREMS